MKHVRLLSLLIALVVCLFAIPASAEVTTATTTYTVDAEALGLPSNDELFAYYVEQKLYGYEWATWGTAAREQLSAPMQKMYDVLKPEIENIASGTSATMSTAFTFTPDALAEMGFTTKAETPEILQSKLDAELSEYSTLVNALLRDCPFDMYWIDYHGGYSLSSYSYSYTSEDAWLSTDITLTMSVAIQFRANEEDATTVRTVDLTEVNKNVQSILVGGEDLNDYDRLAYYAQKIMELVNYNDDAAADSSYYDRDSNPWQLLWVFDGDDTTNVVCEGYSKAFQYLCDLTETFNDVECYTVTGTMNGGDHMWNIVKWNGKNYLIDVTNSESVETTGNNTYTPGTGGLLFMKDPASGSVAEGYTFNTVSTINNGKTVYVYADDLIWGQDVLTLGAVAIVDDGNDITYFQDFTKAAELWNSKNGSTLTLLGDCKTSTITSSASNLTFNLNGFTLQNETSSSPVITNTTNLTIVGPGTIKAGNYSAGIENTSGTLTITGAPTFNCVYTFRYINGIIDLTNATPSAIDGWDVMNASGAAMNADQLANIKLPSGYALCDKTSKEALTELAKLKTATITTPVATNYVADVDGTKYEVFQEAVIAWQQADGTSTLKLLANVTDFHAGIEKTGRILDLNGFSWQNKTYQNMVLQVKSEGSLLIQDSIGTGKIIRSDSDGAALDVDGKLTITGSVTIDAPIDISIAGTVDLRSATNCEGWVVDNATFDLSTLEGYPLMLYADEWLPTGYALEINNKIDYELDENATGIIVEHGTCTENDWGYDEEDHWKKCDCGRTLTSGSHTMGFTDNGDGNHKQACSVCSYVAIDEEAHTLHYSADDDTTIITESCSKNCGHTGTATISAENTTYDGTAKETATVTCSDGWTGSEPTVSYENNTNAGTATASITVDEATASVNFTIAKATLTITANAQSKTYGDVDPTLTYVASGLASSDNLNNVLTGELTRAAGENAGTYAITQGTLSAGSNYTISFTGAVLTIKSKYTDSAIVTLEKDSYQYAGTAKKPGVTSVVVDGKTLDAANYDVTYSNNTNVGTATVTITFKGNYTGTVTTSFEITKATLTVTADNKTMTTGHDLPDLTYTIAGFVNDETEKVLTTKPVAQTSANGQTAGTFEITVSGAEAANYDFSYVKGTLTVADHQHAWTCTATGDTITATCGNADTCSVTPVTIQLVAPADLTYDGTAKAVTVTQTPAGVFGDIPAVSYCCTGDCINAGEHTAKLTYRGVTAEKKFTISQRDITGATIGTFAEMTYNGAAQTPSATVTIDGLTVTGSWNPVTNVGEKSSFTATGNFTGTLVDDPNMSPKAISITGATIEDVLYQEGGQSTLNVTGVTFADVTLTLNTDYTASAVLTGKNEVAKDVTATVTVTLSNSNFTLSPTTFTGSVNIVEHTHVWTYTVNGDTITATCSGTIGTCPDNKQSATLNAPGAVYSGNPVNAEVSLDGADLAYTLHYTGTNYDSTNAPTNAGDYTVTMTLGTAKVSKVYTISPASIEGATIDNIDAVTYNTEAQEPKVTVSISMDGSDSDKALTLNTDYTVEYTDNVNVGTATVIVTGKGNYTGTKTAAFTINPAQITDSALSVSDCIYTGEALEPEVTVKVFPNVTMVKDTDYDVAYENNVNVGKATVTVTGKGNYTGIATTNFLILESGAIISAKSYLGDVEQTAFTYGDTITITGKVESTGKLPETAQTLSLRTTNNVEMYIGDDTTSIAGVTLDENNNFILTCNTAEKYFVPSTNAITLTVKYLGGNMAPQSATVSITLAPKPLTVTGATAASRTYDGTNQVAINTVTLDGILTVNGTTDNVSVNTPELMGTISSANAGEYTTVTLPEMTLTGEHAANYTLTQPTEAVTTSVTISAADITGASVTAANQVYTGNELKPAVTVTLGDKILKLDTDYTVAYSNNTNVGTATVTVTGKGNYEDQAQGSFVITSAPADLTAETYLDETKTGDFTYGDVITIKGAVTVDQSSTFSLRSAPAKNEVALYLEDGTEVIAGPVAADPATGEFTLTYDTSNKDIGIGQKNLTLVYVSDGNKQDTTGSLTVTLNKKELTIASAVAVDRVYAKGNKLVDVTSVTLKGIIPDDNVVADLSGIQGTLTSDNAGEYTTLALPALNTTGNEMDYYTIAANDAVTTNVKITPKEVTTPTIVLDPATFVYDGTAKEPAVTVKDGETVIPATEYTVSYQNNTDVGTEAAKPTVVIADNDGGNYTVNGTKEFAITQSPSVVTAKSYLGDVEQTAFTYGDTITIKGQAAVDTTAQTFALRARVNTAALYYGNTQLGEIVEVAADNTFTLTYDTAGKDLLIGESTLTVEFGGNGNLAGTTATVTVKLNKADPKADTPTDLKATYGQTLVDVPLPKGWAWNNDTTTPVGDAGTQTFKATYTSPVDADYYNTVVTDVNIEVERLAITGVTAPGDQALNVYCPTVEDIIAQLPKTLPGTGADGNSYNVPVEWSFSGEEFNDVPEAENPFTWKALPGDNFTIPDAATGSITVKNGKALPVAITGTDTAITYNGSTFDVSKMFTIDENAGAATFSIVSNGTDAGAGTLGVDGKTLTITKSGTITIKVTTAAHTVNGTPYAAGEATAVLTVSKGTPAYTVPTGLSATYGDTLADVTLPEGWAWKEDVTTKVGDAGERIHKATFTPTATDLWNTVEADVTITVAKAAIPLEGVAATYLDTVAKTVFTYGQTITVKATPAMPMTMALSFDEPEPNQMALFYGDTQISAPADAVDGTYTMTYQTTGKVLPIGDSKIRVKYVGTTNISDGTFDLTVTLEKANLTVSSVTLKNRAYEPGNSQVEVTAATLSGIIGSDEVLADTAKMRCILKANGEMTDKVGEYTEVILPAEIPLTGAHAAYYTAEGGTAIAATVSITKATPVANGTPDFENVTPGTALKDVPTDAIEELYKPVEGTVTWTEPDATVEPGKEYEYTFTPKDTENYESVTGTAVIIPVAPPQPVVPPVVLPTVTVPTEAQLVTVCEGETADMSVTAINATAYQWYINRNDGLGWRAIIGADAPAYTTSPTTLDADGFLYLCRVSNADGAVNSPVFTLDVVPALDVPPTGDNTPVMLLAAMLFLSAAGLVIMASKKRSFN